MVQLLSIGRLPDTAAKLKIERVILQPFASQFLNIVIKLRNDGGQIMYLVVRADLKSWGYPDFPIN